MATKRELEAAERELLCERMKVAAANMKMMRDLMQGVPSFAEDADENQWKVLNQLQQEFYTEADIKSMQETALKLYYTNPSAFGIIETMVNFIIGKTATITPKEGKNGEKEYWDAFCTKNRWNRRSREHVRRALRDGEALLRFFEPSKVKADINGKVDKIPYVRFVEPAQIQDTEHSYGIETDPEDVETVINYYRRYTIGNVEKSEVIPATHMVHTKIRVDSNVKRGVSFLVGIAKYIVKYDSWLNDRILLNKIRTLFNMVMKVSGITPEAFKSKFTDSTRERGTSSINKKIPPAGSVVVATPGLEYEFQSLNIRAQDTKDDGRNIELMVCKGTNLTEYIVRGDASNANYSSTMVSESPMVKMFESWQDFFEDEFKQIYALAIRFGIKSGALKPTASEECNVNFPGLIHRDAEKETKAMILQRQARMVSTKTASEHLGHNYEKEHDQIEKEDEEEYRNEFRRENEEPVLDAEGDDEE